MVAAYIASALTLLMGLIAFLAPHKAARLCAIGLPEGRSISEYRATYGGFFIGLAVACLRFRTEVAFAVAGAAWLAAATARLVSMLIDRQFTKMNAASLGIEAGVGFLFLVPLFTDAD